MPSVKKIKPVSFEIIDKVKALDALEIQFLVSQGAMQFQFYVSYEEIRQTQWRFERLWPFISAFENKHHHSFYDVVGDIWRWYSYITREGIYNSPQEIYKNYVECVSQVKKVPMNLFRWRDVCQVWQ